MRDITPGNAQKHRAPHGTIGNAIERLRKERNLTQVQLAKRVQRTQSAIASYESGRICPSLMTLKRMAAEFNIPVEYMLSHRRSLFSKDTIRGLNERKPNGRNQEQGQEPQEQGSEDCNVRHPPADGDAGILLR